MPIVHRLVKALHSATAFQGEGTVRYGGRWNSRGTRLVYTAESRALAALETLVHIDRSIPFDWVMFSCEINEKHVERLSRGALPPGWRAEPPTLESQTIGDRWLREMRSAVLAVPSAIVPEEWNYLLNPLHSDFAAVKSSGPRPFSFDTRLLRE